MSKVPSPTKSTIPWAGILNLLAAVIYGVSPLDLIPDVIPLLGWLDDAVAIPLFVGLGILAFIRHRKNWRESARVQTVVDVPAREPQIPTSYR